MSTNEAGWEMPPENGLSEAVRAARPKSERCETCRFWRRMAAGVDAGNCKRRAPRYYPELAIARMDQNPTQFPVTDEFDWCGEFEWLSHLEPVTCC